MSNGSDQSNGSKNQQQQQQQRSKKHPDKQHRSSSGSGSNTNKYASCIATNAETSPYDLHGGGKMPANATTTAKTTGISKNKKSPAYSSGSSGNNNNRLNSDFGDRGSSWELEWKQSSSP
jgi:hypothetical protein